MKKIVLLSFLILALAAALVVSCAPPLALSDESADRAAAVVPDPLKCSVTTDKTLYHPGEIVKMRVTLTNMGSKPVTINFGTTQRFDFTVSHYLKVLWQWSAGRVFLPVTGKATILPGKTLTYPIAEYKAQYVPGVTGSPDTITLDLTGKIASTPGYAGRTQFKVSRYIPL